MPSKGCLAAIAALAALLIVGTAALYLASRRPSTPVAASSPTPSRTGSPHIGTMAVTMTHGAGGFIVHPLVPCVQVVGGRSVYGMSGDAGIGGALSFKLQGYPEQGSQHYPKGGTYTVGQQVTASLTSFSGSAAAGGGTLVVKSDGMSGSFTFDFQLVSGGKTTSTQATGTYTCP